MEFYGFFLYIASFLLLIAYLIWTLVPDKLLQNVFCIAYYPAKQWAIVVPNFVVVAMVFAYLVVICIQLKGFPSWNSVNYVLDRYSNVANEDYNSCKGTCNRTYNANVNANANRNNNETNEMESKINDTSYETTKNDLNAAADQMQEDNLLKRPKMIPLRDVPLWMLQPSTDR